MKRFGVSITSKHYRKRIAAVMLVVAICATLSGCSGAKIRSVNSCIEKLMTDSDISQDELDKALEDYKSLDDSHRTEIENADELLKYDGVTLADLNDVQNKIDALGDDAKVVDIAAVGEHYDELTLSEQALIKTSIDFSKLNGVDANKIDNFNAELADIDDNTSFKDLISLQEAYENFSENERSFVKDYSKISDRMTLTDLERACIGACEYIKKTLKNPSSFNLTKICAKDDTAETSFYLVIAYYTATNGYGGTQGDSVFQTIDKDFENPWYALNLIGTLAGARSSTDSLLDCSAYQSRWTANDDEPTYCDVDKIMYYLNNGIPE